jgi:hypothetical protein
VIPRVHPDAHGQEDEMETTRSNGIDERSVTPRMVFWSALTTSVLALVAFVIAATTPPRTGPFAAPRSLIAYPFAAADRFVPADFIWMYPVLLMVLAYLFLSVCLRERASAGARVWGTFGLCLAVTSFAVLAIAYFSQIYAIQPALVAREAADVVALSQYNPHGFFIALENLGYLAMALSLGAFALTFAGTRLQTATRWTLGLAAVIAVLALVVMSAVYGVGLEYRFEVAIITIDYFALVAGGALIAASSRKTAFA